jgi:hypothetical protein
MQPMRIEIQAGDPATGAAVRRELEALRGQEPSGAELLDDPTPRTRGLDPLVATALVGLVAGIAGGAGQQIGVTVMTWLIERIRALAGKRKTSVLLIVDGVSQQVDANTRAEDAARKLLKVS